MTWPVLGALLCVVTCSAQAREIPPQTSADFQAWNEIDLTAPLAVRFQLTWVSWVRLSSSLGGPVTYANGADADLKLGGHMTLTPSYYTYDSLKSATGQWVKAREPVLAATFARELQPCQLSDRNRIALVAGEGDAYWVYRIRAKLDCRVSADLLGVSLFVWDEVFHYSVFHSWTRNRFAQGFHITVNKRCGVDLYYLHQADEEVQPRDINGVGITLQLRLGSTAGSSTASSALRRSLTVYFASDFEIPAAGVEAGSPSTTPFTGRPYIENGVS